VFELSKLAAFVNYKIMDKKSKTIIVNIWIISYLIIFLILGGNIYD